MATHVHRIVKRGDLFSTFNFDGRDCADMGVYSVTSGAVYTMNLEPKFKDDMLEVPKYDGQYYFGTQITGQQFEFNCFCHDLLATEYDRLRAWLFPRRVGRLILSDQPYKYYIVKVVSISSLGAYPLTTIQTPQNHPIGSYIKGEVVYTGNFTVTFETVGSAYGYGLSCYRDDLIYDAKMEGYPDNYYYNTGLIYREMAPGLIWKVDQDAFEQPIPMYNPGSAEGHPTYCVFGSFGDNTYLEFKNHTTGSFTVVDVSGMSSYTDPETGVEYGFAIDMTDQTITDYNNGIVVYGRFQGEPLYVTPYRTVDEIPETYTKEIENKIYEYDTFYIENGDTVIFNPEVVTVNLDWCNMYFCCNYNDGSRIIEVNLDGNYIKLETPTENIPRGHDDIPSGIPYHFRGWGLPDDIQDPQEHDVLLYEEEIPGREKKIHCFIYMKRKDVFKGTDYRWIDTHYFSSEDDFKDIHGDYVDSYKVFGATVVDLDDITITTGLHVGGASANEFVLEANMLPRYL